jgi:protein TonB
MAFVDLGKYSSRRAVSVTGVVLVHAALGYALINGLAYKVIKERFKVFIVDQIEAPKVPPPIPPETVVDRRTKITAPEHPIVDTAPGPDTPIIDQTEIRQPTIVQDPGPSTALPPYARTLQVKGDRTAWVTTEDYPPESVRNGEEGRVAFTVKVGTNGRVSSCQVTASSGYPALDKAACSYYTRRGRFLPSLASDGTPVEASRPDSVRWQLPAQ